MKIIRVETDMSVELMADSAWRPDHRPYFVPDMAVTTEIRPAIRIARLGKNITCRFARRYYDSVTALAFNRICSDKTECPQSLYDDSIIIGTWLPLTDMPLTLHSGPHAATLDIDLEAVDKMIERLSSACTFKTGDIIVLPQSLFSFTPQVDTTVNITTGDSTGILLYNVK